MCAADAIKTPKDITKSFSDPFLWSQSQTRGALFMRNLIPNPLALAVAMSITATSYLPSAWSQNEELDSFSTNFSTTFPPTPDPSEREESGGVGGDLTTEKLLTREAASVVDAMASGLPDWCNPDDEIL